MAKSTSKSLSRTKVALLLNAKRHVTSCAGDDNLSSEFETAEKKRFEEYDTNNDGFLSTREEFKAWLVRFGLMRVLQFYNTTIAGA